MSTVLTENPTGGRAVERPVREVRADTGEVYVYEIYRSEPATLIGHAAPGESVAVNPNRPVGISVPGGGRIKVFYADEVGEDDE